MISEEFYLVVNVGEKLFYRGGGEEETVGKM